MNKINKLLDEKYVIELFTRKVLPKYPSFDLVKSIKISTPKKYIWDFPYHVVIKYQVVFITKENKRKNLKIYATAHSDEPRKNVYDVLRFLWTHNFNRGYLTIPHPLFFDEYFNATFYRSVDGNHLFSYIEKGEMDVVEDVVVKVAKWLAKLHSLPTSEAIGFNIENSRIKTAIPGVTNIFKAIEDLYPEDIEDYKKIYKVLIAQEESFLSSTNQRWLVHGDAHPENVIRMGEKKLAFIDFADMCVTDFARDLGTFLQQLEYMLNGEQERKFETEKFKKLLIETYLNETGIKMDKNLEQRIKCYYNWTAIRTATYFFIKESPDPLRAKLLLDSVKKELKI